MPTSRGGAVKSGHYPAGMGVARGGYLVGFGLRAALRMIDACTVNAYGWGVVAFGRHASFLLSLAIAACGARMGELDEVTAGPGELDAGLSPEAAVACTSTDQCPDPSCVYPGAWCGSSPGLQGGSCPTSVVTPECGTPVVCTCGGEFWGCVSTTVPGCTPTCPPASRVGYWVRAISRRTRRALQRQVYGGSLLVYLRRLGGLDLHDKPRLGEHNVPMTDPQR
jgi:hypothetical protein